MTFSKLKWTTQWGRFSHINWFGRLGFFYSHFLLELKNNASFQITKTNKKIYVLYDRPFCNTIMICKNAHFFVSYSTMQTRQYIRNLCISFNHVSLLSSLVLISLLSQNCFGTAFSSHGVECEVKCESLLHMCVYILYIYTKKKCLTV